MEKYTGTFYPLNTTLLQPLFKELRKSEVTPPLRPITEGKKGVKAEEGEMSNWQRFMYTEEVKLYLRKKERLKATLIALYNVVWGQCSRKMKGTGCPTKMNTKKSRSTLT